MPSVMPSSTFAGQIVSCPSCQQKNRLPQNLRSDEVTCGKCKFSFHLPPSVLWPGKIDIHPPEAYRVPPARTGDEDEEETKDAREPLRGLRVGPAEVPGWMCAVGLGAVAILAIASISSPSIRQRVLDTAAQARGIFVSPEGKQTEFLRTYVFWVPLYQSDGAPYASGDFDALHSWLNTTFGGWTRWSVQGADASTPAGSKGQQGWFYQASLPKPKEGESAPKVSIDSLRDKIHSTFAGVNPYVIEQPHFTATR